ncbi:glycoside hydrolase family 25 protein [Brumimicrobium aurantiacum]|uniref:Glycosyl hydrolase family 25 n=1 Tax=Brumimicrobium aurantiacum TaxID=1737063 RepID=A0A3E1EYR4_9FLAO|nr:GH25 family lysozyme [Brumimicrobium aurantiacum]RFC54694.1 glycosyl hydrolase family 25 [Brumimicrobium aurantiacum]
MKRKSVSLFTLLILIGAFLLILWNTMQFNNNNQFNQPIPTNYKGFGIDVSHHQGQINWDTLLSRKVTPQIQFVYLKATEGINHVDREWDYNRNKLLDLGIKHGAYHFFRPNIDPVTQAKHFLSNYKPLEKDLTPVLDVEIEGQTDDVLLQDVALFLSTIEKQTGKRPIIYTSFHFYRTKFQDSFLNYKFWIAAYSTPFVLPKDERILYWQFTDQADLPFHRGVKVDLNVSRINFDTGVNQK